MSIFRRFDNSKRTPRAAQAEALAWIEANINARVIALSLPTGVGKSAIARAIQVALRADIVVPTNQLMGQYTDIYPTVNALKGKIHYPCKSLPGLSCGDAKALVKEQSPDNKGNPSDGYCTKCVCPFKKAFDKAQTEPTFFNPYSLVNLNYVSRKEAPKKAPLVIDEAHNLIEFFNSKTGKIFRSKDYMLPYSLADFRIDQWLQEQIDRLEKLPHTTVDEMVAIYNEIEHISNVRDGYNENPENYAADLELKGKKPVALTLRPVLTPRVLANRLFQNRQVILLSATLFESDVKEIVGHDKFSYLSIPSPIKKENRKVKYSPSDFKMNANAEPALVAAKINDVVGKHKGQNILIHMTYGMAKRVIPYLDFDFVHNTPENKEETINAFKSNGGIFIASGCNEGLDLNGDTCRINIIPMLFRLNPTDTIIRKRLGLPGGQAWYDEQTLKAFIQAAGRSTRGEDDYSLVYVLDPAFPRLIRNPQIKVPSYVKEAIQWHA